MGGTLARPPTEGPSTQRLPRRRCPADGGGGSGLHHEGVLIPSAPRHSHETMRHRATRSERTVGFGMLSSPPRGVATDHPRHLQRSRPSAQASATRLVIRSTDESGSAIRSRAPDSRSGVAELAAFVVDAATAFDALGSGGGRDASSPHATARHATRRKRASNASRVGRSISQSSCTKRHRARSRFDLTM